ncbi:MAG: helix-turn-helix transcriptional regulator [Cyanobacteria bacterium SZAS LIN-5]|nr:helix-turn-helix transcriptional regulator [Cyanobacteria bacterium SZAS LIN-5]
MLLNCLGQAISARRDRLRLTQAELAMRSGVDRAFISNIENGKRNPSFSVLVDIAKGLNISLSLLMRHIDRNMEEHNAN